jgi:tRNA-(ms[2]io[6]A)-hydroxylase
VAVSANRSGDDPIHAVLAFLQTPTPAAWIGEATGRIPELLLDHANCELKAASTALGIIYRYPEQDALVHRMSRLAREELRHFEQVRQIMQDMRLPFMRLSASRYAGTLRESVRQGEPQRLIDILIVGALIEARSCERFAVLTPKLPKQLSGFYGGLLLSEARHFEHYLSLARSVCQFDDTAFNQRLAELRRLESKLITSPDEEFRFHSGPPVE